MGNETEWSRRALLVKGAAAMVAAGTLPAALAQSSGSKPPVADTGAASGNKVSFPDADAATEKPAGDPPNQQPPDQRVGFAVIGLGRLSLEQILPAFASCKQARLAAVVSGTPDKAQTVARQYGLPASDVYSYERFEELGQRKDVQAVYIVLPNALHRPWVERAAKLGKQVLCEKPMSVSSGDAAAMVAACHSANVKLMIAYRCQYEITNRFLDDQVRAGKLGTIRSIHAINVQNMAERGEGLEQWRFKKALAGAGSLPDVGLYCLNGSRALLGEEPIEISAQIQSPPNDPRFREVEDMVDFTLRFPSGAVASCSSAYSAHQLRLLTVAGSEAWARMDKAFDYRGQTLHLSRLDGQGREHERARPGLQEPVLARARPHGRMHHQWPLATDLGRGRGAGPQADGGHLRGGADRPCCAPAGWRQARQDTRAGAAAARALRVEAELAFVPPALKIFYARSERVDSGKEWQVACVWGQLSP